MKTIGDFVLMKSTGHEGQAIFRYNSEVYKDILGWRETEVEAEADLLRFERHLLNDTKGIAHMQAMDFLTAK